jgi:hypothetical protein
MTCEEILDGLLTFAQDSESNAYEPDRVTRFGAAILIPR